MDIGGGMRIFRAALTSVVGALFALTGCSFSNGSAPGDVGTLEAIEHDSEQDTAYPPARPQETFRPVDSGNPFRERSQRGAELESAGFEQQQLTIFSGNPLPEALAGECQAGVTPRCFTDAWVYDKCLADPYGSGQYACPVTSLDDLVILDANAPEFDPSVSYSDQAQEVLGFAEVQAQDTGELMFCSPRTGGTGFDGPEPFPLWLGVCFAPSISDDNTFVYWMGALGEGAEVEHSLSGGFWVEALAEQPEIAYVIHGPDHDPNEIHYADILVWYY